MTKNTPTRKINSATFKYFGGLENLLVKRYREGIGRYRFKGTPGIKDAIETMGIPHTEVDVILVNNHSVKFSYQLQHKDQVSVYPVHACPPGELLIHLSPQPELPVKFVLDVHLGSLARRLRLLGFDSLYRNDFADAEIVDISAATARIVLTRDLGILKHKHVEYGYLVRSDHLEEQISEVMTRFQIGEQVKPFSRCMACNGDLVAVDKQDVLSRLEPKTRLYYETFHGCAECDRIYWRGSHYVKIEQWLSKYLGNGCTSLKPSESTS